MQGIPQQPAAIALVHYYIYMLPAYIFSNTDEANIYMIAFIQEQIVKSSRGSCLEDNMRLPRRYLSISHGPRHGTIAEKDLNLFH